MLNSNSGTNFRAVDCAINWGFARVCTAAPDRYAATLAATFLLTPFPANFSSAFLPSVIAPPVVPISVANAGRVAIVSRIFWPVPLLARYWSLANS